MANPVAVRTDPGPAPRPMGACPDRTSRSHEAGPTVERPVDAHRARRHRHPARHRRGGAARAGGRRGDHDLRLEVAAPSVPPHLALDSLVLAESGPWPPGDAPPPGDEARASSLRWWGRTLRWSTAASLVATSTLGTMAAINQPTAFGDGRCITGDPVLGTYGCDRGLSTLHGSSAVVSVTLYTANGVLALAAPESRGQVSEAARPWYRVLSWVHLGGMVLQPIMGLPSPRSRR